MDKGGGGAEQGACRGNQKKEATFFAVVLFVPRSQLFPDFSLILSLLCVADAAVLCKLTGRESYKMTAKRAGIFFLREVQKERH